MRTTPSTREFTSEPVPDEVVRHLLEVARFAPSGGNRQAWHVIVLRDPGIRRRIRDLYVLSWREYMAHVRAGLVPFAPLDHGRWTGPAVDLEEARATPAPLAFADHLDEVPVLLVLVAELAGLAVLDNGLDRQSIIGGASVYPFAHNVLLAAGDAGLGGVLTTVLGARGTSRQGTARYSGRSRGRRAPGARPSRQAGHQVAPSDRRAVHDRRPLRRPRSS